MRILIYIILFNILWGCTKNTSRGSDISQSDSHTRVLQTKQQKTPQQQQKRGVAVYHGNTSRNNVANQSTRIKMVKKSGVYYVPIKINDTDMEFIFDTGASDIVISAVEALFLYKQGKLTNEDVLGTARYQIADGSISEGTVVNLKTVQLGDKTLYNVKASVVHKMEAPLLLGQSALSQFGKISINYKENYIEFVD